MHFVDFLECFRLFCELLGMFRNSFGTLLEHSFDFFGLMCMYFGCTLYVVCMYFSKVHTKYICTFGNCIQTTYKLRIKYIQKHATPNGNPSVSNKITIHIYSS